jgi:hypothetical protein
VWLDKLLIELSRSGPQGRSSFQYLTDHKIKVGFHDQPTGARWTITGNIELHPRFANGPPDAPYPLSLLIHEVRHLQQGLFTALSVYGELDAWQVQFSFLKSLTGQYHPILNKNSIIEDLMSLSVVLDRKVLKRSILLMKNYAGNGYLVNLLPLYPLPREIFIFLTRKEIKH